MAFGSEFVWRRELFERAFVGQGPAVVKIEHVGCERNCHTQLIARLPTNAVQEIEIKVIA